MFRRALELQPEDSWSHNNLAIALLKSGRLEEAAAAFQRAIHLNPDFSESHENRGAALTGLERWAEAAAVYGRALELDPENLTSRINLGVVLFRLERWEEAASALGSAIERSSEAAELLPIRAASLVHLRRWEEAEEVLRGAIALNPDSPDLHTNRANALVSLERWEEAEQALRGAIALRPDTPELHASLVTVLVNLQRWSEAEQAVHGAIALNPQSPELHWVLASTLVGMERWEEAALAIQRTIALNPESAELHASLANALANLERWDEAIAAMAAAIELDPQSVALRSNLAANLVKLERWEEAAVAYQEAIELDPAQPGIFRSLGAVLMQAESWEGAAAAYRHSLVLDPENSEAYVNLATVLTNVGHSEEALAGHRQMVALAPDDSAVHLGLGVELSKSGQWTEAASTLERASSLAADDTSCQFLLVEPLLRLGRLPEAAAAHRRVVAPEGALPLLPSLPGEPAADRFERRRQAFWTAENLPPAAFRLERWLEQLASAPATAPEKHESVGTGRLLFVLDNDYGELTTLKYLVLGQPLRERTTLLLPERLIANNADALPGRTHGYASSQDILRLVAAEEPEIVFLCSGYLFSIHEILTLEDLEQLVGALRERGCRVVTADPFLGMLSKQDPRTLISIHIPEESDELEVEELRKVKEIEDKRLQTHFTRCEKLFRDDPHLYPTYCDVPSHEVTGSDARNLSFFNSELILPDLGASTEDTDSASRPHWLFILSRTDYETQMMFAGRKFADIVAGNLVDALAAGRHPILIAPDELVQSVISRMPTVEGVDILSFCPFNRLISLLLSAEYAFYWNIVSHSILIRLFNKLPVILFDRGHLVRNVTPMYDRVVQWYYQGWEPEFRDHREPLTLDTVSAWSEDYRSAADRICEGFRRAPTPGRMIEQLMSADEPFST